MLQDRRGVVRFQAEHGQVHQGQREAGLHRIALVVGYLDIVDGRVAGGELRPPRGQADVEGQLHWRDDQLDQAHTDIRHRVALVDALHHRHPDEDVRCEEGGNGDLQHVTGALEGDDPLLDDVASLDGQPGPGGAGEG